MNMSCLLYTSSLEEIAAETGMEREDVVLAVEAGVEVESIYKTVYQSDGNEMQLLDKVAAGGEMCIRDRG